MRRPVTAARVWASVAVVACAVASAAHADDAKPFVIGDHADQLAVYRDNLGSFYVVPIAGAKDIIDWVFFGTAKTMYQQRITTSSTTDQPKTWTLWAPRAKRTGTLERRDDKLFVSCRPKESRELVQLGADEAKALLAHAKLLPPLWHRQPYLLARDDDGAYYYVDGSAEDRYTDVRLYVGLKGAMKELAMTNMIHDSAGDLYATKAGTLKITIDIRFAITEAVWVKDGKKIALTVVDVVRDQYLIYRELGVYGQLGTICEDQ
jgi:hypothetical protein